MPLDFNLNTGVLVKLPEPSDYIAGGETGIVWEDRLQGKSWLDYRPANELQVGLYFDTMACTNFARGRSISFQMNYLIRENILPSSVVQAISDLGFIDNQGNFNDSDRFNAKISGTTRSGNYLNAGWEASRTQGLLPEKDWPFPVRQQQPPFLWEEYYKLIPTELLAKAKEILKYIEIKYEWVVINAGAVMTDQIRMEMAHHILQAPLSILSPTCPPWNTTNILLPCGKTIPTHATTIYEVEIDGTFDDFDHYDPFLKRLSKYYPIPFALKGVVYPRLTPLPPERWHYTFNKDIRLGDDNAEVRALQRALQILGLMKVGVFGRYGAQTQAAVRAFQAKYKVANVLILAVNNGKFVGSATRAALNKIFV